MDYGSADKKPHFNNQPMSDCMHADPRDFHNKVRH